ncbi:MAG: DUF3109 family protein [Bacteroidetes bacterium]|jgi:hypothetical protein|nr:DUF3109 family protein [Bacteroidota bacterium]MBP6640361.1 DUF3109 family protein [Bacteroidia bacterium]MBP6722478.1 DUF3109 family protein [Bacteroidia bacterium]
MFIIDDKLVSEDLLRVHFVCDLDACKGACCVEGDLGAPLDADELPILDEIYPAVQPYLSEKSQQAIAQQGKYVVDEDGFASTTLVNGKECAYVVFKEGMALCGIEMAHKDGKIPFLKPISCHLYPVRLKDMALMEMEAINYDRWDICNAACKLGRQLKMPVYKFLKGPLTRKFGEDFYAKMCETFEAYEAAEKE